MRYPRGPNKKCLFRNSKPQPRTGLCWCLFPLLTPRLALHADHLQRAIIGGWKNCLQIPSSIPPQHCVSISTRHRSLRPAGSPPAAATIVLTREKILAAATLATSCSHWQRKQCDAITRARASCALVLPLSPTLCLQCLWPRKSRRLLSLSLSKTLESILRLYLHGQPFVCPQRPETMDPNLNLAEFLTLAGADRLCLTMPPTRSLCLGRQIPANWK